MRRIFAAVVLLLLSTAHAQVINIGEGCQVLIRARDSEGPDEGFVWMRGDMVMVKPIECRWARGELKRYDFVIVTIEGADWQDLKRELEMPAIDEHHNLIRIRLRRMIWANLPEGMRNGLGNTGAHTIHWNDLHECIHNMRTGLPDLGGAQLMGGE